MKILNGKRYYRPREIAELGLITTSRGADGSVDGNYNFILEHIRIGKLKARNYSTGQKMKYYLVSEDEIKRFNGETEAL